MVSQLLSVSCVLQPPLTPTYSYDTCYNGDTLVAWGGKLAYHPQTELNGLAECFNRTLTDMLAKKVEENRRY